jgi:hypothetical protein
LELPAPPEADVAPAVGAACGVEVAAVAGVAVDALVGEAGAVAAGAQATAIRSAIEEKKKTAKIGLFIFPPFADLYL